MPVQWTEGGAADLGRGLTLTVGQHVQYGKNTQHASKFYVEVFGRVIKRRYETEALAKEAAERIASRWLNDIVAHIGPVAVEAPPPSAVTAGGSTITGGLDSNR